ncbi:hypothetical protein NIES4102_43730 (plasmid) [Chondrocystis sp. NIES-4102]|nr:hypothetical protein NIES4102_43730 [Chondrocystis sp. NIES-4102]
MAYLAEKPALKTSERQLITIEFAPPQDPKETEYTYPQPLFVFTEQVVPKNNPSSLFKVCAMELIESKTPSGQLLNQPYWKYKLTDGQKQIWKDESTLVRYFSNCSQCPHFDDYRDPDGRGWCHLSNRKARTYHQQTNDCIVSSDLEISHEFEDKKIIFSNIDLDAFATDEIEDEADLPYSEYQVGSIVKVIDKNEHHQEWAVFEIIECLHNKSLYRSTESYLNQAEWYFRLRSNDDASTICPSLWVREDEICPFDQSHNISTQYIF